MIVESALDHPCKLTCSGWREGRKRGFQDAIDLLGSDAAISEYVNCTDVLGISSHEWADWLQKKKDEK